MGKSMKERPDSMLRHNGRVFKDRQTSSSLHVIPRDKSDDRNLCLLKLLG
jgi:hypothetical protein